MLKSTNPMKVSTSVNDLADIITAIYFAASAHKDQRRKNSTSDPYINHPIEVASLLADAGITNIDVLRAAVLHDVIEDCGIKPTEIKEKFGENVCRIVIECTDDKSLDKVSRKRAQVSHAKTISAEAKLVKLADKISNIKNLVTDPPTSWTDEIVYGYVVWARAVYEGIRGQNQYLDNLIEEIFAKHGVTKLNKNELEDYYNTLEVQQLI